MTELGGGNDFFAHFWGDCGGEAVDNFLKGIRSGFEFRFLVFFKRYGGEIRGDGFGCGLGGE